MANEIKRLIRSFGHALQGLKVLFSSQKNAFIHFFLMLVSVVFGVLLNISSIEWVLIIICSGMVMAAEAFNTALEKMADT
ncbi:MAG: diacylglycerol kinase family protein, partial [Verrucomicrobiota bacterium]|nr:diacylglycerol kinase family protein [Verrucomicrobiota bacterium]